MAKVIEGIGLIAGAIGLGLLAVLDPAISGLAFIALEDIAAALGVGGASLTLAGIAGALGANASLPLSIRQPAAPRQCVYGQIRLAGVIHFQ